MQKLLFKEWMGRFLMGEPLELTMHPVQMVPGEVEEEVLEVVGVSEVAVVLEEVAVVVAALEDVVVALEVTTMTLEVVVLEVRALGAVAVARILTAMIGFKSAYWVLN